MRSNQQNLVSKNENKYLSLTMATFMTMINFRHSLKSVHLEVGDSRQHLGN